ncbi:MAG: PP2C family protein-serine/threonine phosphatase, partial [Bacteroidia bacterium]
LAIEHLEKTKEYGNLANAYSFLAREIFERMEMIDEAVVYLKKSIYTHQNEKGFSLDFPYYVLGWLETTNNKLDSGQVHLEKAYSIAKQNNAYYFMPELLIWLGNNKSFRKDYKSAFPFFYKAKALADSVKNEFSFYEAERYIAYNHYYIGNLDSAITHLKPTADFLIRTNAQMDHKYHVGAFLIRLLVRNDQLNEARKYVDILKDTTSFNYKENQTLRSVIHGAFFEYHYKNKDYEKAITYLIDHHRWRDSMELQVRRVNLGEQNLKLEFQKQKELISLDQQKRDFQAKQKLKDTQTFNYLLGGVSLFVLILLGFSVFTIKQRKQSFKIISQQKEEVEHQKALVEVKNKEVLDSIHYAKRIQEALLANTSFIDTNVPNNFILYKPKDIISGDFYWATKKDNCFYLAICDSTGHGVPGAFMSLLNIGYLSEAINEKNILKPNEVLDYVRERLITSISSEHQKDGFDGTLLCFDKEKNQLVYSSAHNTPVLIRNGQLHKLSADKMPVGKSEKNAAFTFQQVDLEKDDMLYFYTDGYADQFGGAEIKPNGKKFKQKNLLKLFERIHKEDLSEQKRTLSQEFDKWKGNLEQIDDVCIVGIRI